MKLFSTREVCEKAKKANTAVGLFVIKNMEGVQGVLSAAQKTNSPVILGISGRDFKSIGDLESFILYIKSTVNNIDIPVALHFDHGGLQSTKNVIEAIKLGFTGIMYDSSNYEFKENIYIMKKIVKICHAVDVSIEGAIGDMPTGNVGDISEFEESEMDLGSFSNKKEIRYTDPEEAKIFSDETGVDIIAISVGTVHGLTNLSIRIDAERLIEIKKKTSALLSIHGGSGTPEAEIIKLLKGGVSKINIGADLYKAITAHVRKLVSNENKEMVWDFKLSTVIEEVVIKYINTFNTFRVGL